MSGDAARAGYGLVCRFVGQCERPEKSHCFPCRHVRLTRAASAPQSFWGPDGSSGRLGIKKLPCYVAISSTAMRYTSLGSASALSATQASNSSLTVKTCSRVSWSEVGPVFSIQRWQPNNIVETAARDHVSAGPAYCRQRRIADAYFSDIFVLIGIHVCMESQAIGSTAE